MRPVSDSEVRIEKATGEPIMNSDNPTVMPKVNVMAFSGMSNPGCTLAKKLAKGMPTSRAKDLVRVSVHIRRLLRSDYLAYHSCLDAVVTLLIRQHVISSPTRHAKSIEAEYELVALRTTCTHGTPRGVLSTASTSGPMVNMIV